MAPKKTTGSGKGTPAQKQRGKGRKGARGDHKQKKRRTETFSVYIYRVLK